MPGVISLFPLSYTPLALVLAWALKGFRSDGLWVVVVDVPHLIFSLPLALTPFLFLGLKMSEGGEASSLA